jgi:hypothetical protein
VNILRSSVQQAWQILYSGGHRIWQVLQGSGGNIWAILRGTGQRLWTLLQQNTQLLVNILRSSVQQAWQILYNGGTQVWQVLQQAGSQVWSILQGTGQRLWTLLQRNTQVLLNMLRSSIQQAWQILYDSGRQVWQVLQQAGSQALTVLQTTGQRLLTLLQRNTQLLVSMLRAGVQQFWNFVERNAQRLWTLLSDATEPVINALLSAGRDLLEFLKQGFDRLNKLLLTVAKYAGLVIATFGQQLLYYVRTFPQKVIRLGKELLQRNIPAFFEWMWEGVKLLVTNPSGLKEWFASGAKGESKPARVLMAVVDLLPAAEAWAYISTVFRGGRQPKPKEVKTLKPVIGDTVTYPNVRIVENTTLSEDAFVTGHVVNLPPDKSNPTSDDAKMKTFVHEFGHVGQYEAVGSRYMPEAVHAQDLSDQGYNYSLEALENESFASFNREQQASILGDYWGHVKSDPDRVDAEDKKDGSALVIDKTVTVDGEEIGSSGDYYDKYDEIYEKKDPYKRLVEEYKSGNI